MAVNFIDDCEWKENALVAFSGGGYELDTARRVYRGRADKKLAFVASLVRFSPLSRDDPKLFFDNLDDDQDPVFPTITCTYRGFRSGGGKNGLPPPRAEDSQVTKIINVEADLSFSGNYLTPRTKWTWYTDRNPSRSTPQYRTVRGGLNPRDTLFNLTTTDGVPVNPAIAYAYVKDLGLRAIVSDYTIADVIPDAVWMCSCTVDLEFKYPGS